MKWEPAPPLRRLPLAIAKAALSGVILGPPIALVLLLVVKPEMLSVLQKPQWWLFSLAMGAIFATSFYITCSLPQTYLTSFIARWRMSRNRLLRALVGSAGAMAGLLLTFFLLQNVLGMRITNLNHLNELLAAEAVLGAVIALLIGSWVQRDLREKQLQAVTASAQAKALQAQINPHFFFNTLNTIQSLVDSEPHQAKEMIGRLSSMFRYSMQSSIQPAVRFSDELSFVQNYLSIESARFGERLCYALPDTYNDFELPAMILQPLVENAVRHGIAKAMDGGKVRVMLAEDQSGYAITVENTTQQTVRLDEATLFREGHALDNIRQRLRLTYGERAALRGRQDGGTVKIEVTIPR